MIHENTVLILGAGSSREVGFPLGKDLIGQVYSFVQGNSAGYTRSVQGQIVDKVLPNAELLQRLLEISGVKKEDGNDYLVDDIKRFARDLWNAHPESIDDFLFQRPEYSLIGKLSILFVLSGYEDIKRFQPSQENAGTIAIPREYESRSEDYVALVNLNQKWRFPAWGWYEYLWSRLQDGTGRDFDKLTKNELSIITFNYDRSLEHFLFTAINAAYQVDYGKADAAQFFVSIPVKHVYGELGVLPWKFSYLEEYRNQEGALNDFSPWKANVLFRLYGNIGEYGESPEDWEREQDVLSEQARSKIARTFVARAEEIKTYHEVSQDDRCREIFQRAKRVYFLGCGYHEQNLKALGVRKEWLGTDVSVYGSAVGLTDREKNSKLPHVNFLFGASAHIFNSWKEPVPDKSRITSFFRNIAPLR